MRPLVVACCAARLVKASIPSLAGDACELLVALDRPHAVAETLPFVESVASQEEQIHCARALIRYGGPWTPQERARLLRWLGHAKGYSGGHLYFKGMAQAEEDLLRGSGRSSAARSRP